MMRQTARLRSRLQNFNTLLCLSWDQRPCQNESVWQRRYPSFYTTPQSRVSTTQEPLYTDFAMARPIGDGRDFTGRTMTLRIVCAVSDKRSSETTSLRLQGTCASLRMRQTACGSTTAAIIRGIV